MDRKLDRDWEKDNIVYPDPAIEIISDEFKKYVIGNGYIERIFTGSRWSEGPAWFGDGRYLLFSDIPNNRIIKWEEDNGTFSTFRSPSNNANGNARDLQGRLIDEIGNIEILAKSDANNSLNIVSDFVINV